MAWRPSSRSGWRERGATTSTSSGCPRGAPSQTSSLGPTRASFALTLLSWTSPPAGRACIDRRRRVSDATCTSDADGNWRGWGNSTITIARSVDDLLPALEESFRLHDLRWSGRPDGSEFTTPIGRAFNRAAVAAMGDAGLARILLLELDGKPIAFQYYFLFEGGMYVHRLAFDPALARFSPGQVAILAAIEAGAEEGARHVEFLGGNERYKLELADRTAPLHQVICCPRGVRGTIGSKVAVAWVSARLRLKRSESLHKLYVDRLAPLHRAIRLRRT